MNLFFGHSPLHIGLTSHPCNIGECEQILLLRMHLFFTVKKTGDAAIFDISDPDDHYQQNDRRNKNHHYCSTTGTPPQFSLKMHNVCS